MAKVKLTVTVEVVDDNIIGIKEAIANDLEKYGNVGYIHVEEPEQIKLK